MQIPSKAAPPSPTGKPGQAGQAAASQVNSWALDGLRCLNIDLTPAKFGESVTFASLGVDPTLRLTVVNQRRWHWLGAACGLIIFIIGLVRIRSSVASRLRYAIAMVLGTLLIALVGDWMIEMQPVINAVLASAIALVALTIVVAMLRKVLAKINRIHIKESIATNNVLSVPQQQSRCWHVHSLHRRPARRIRQPRRSAMWQNWLRSSMPYRAVPPSRFLPMPLSYLMTRDWRA